MNATQDRQLPGETDFLANGQKLQQEMFMHCLYRICILYATMPSFTFWHFLEHSFFKYFFLFTVDVKSTDINGQLYLQETYDQ